MILRLPLCVSACFMTVSPAASGVTYARHTAGAVSCQPGTTRDRHTAASLSGQSRCQLWRPVIWTPFRSFFSFTARSRAAVVQLHVLHFNTSSENTEESKVKRLASAAQRWRGSSYTGSVLQVRLQEQTWWFPRLRFGFGWVESFCVGTCGAMRGSNLARRSSLSFSWMIFEC